MKVLFQSLFMIDKKRLPDWPWTWHGYSLLMENPLGRWSWSLTLRHVSTCWAFLCTTRWFSFFVEFMGEEAVLLNELQWNFMCNAGPVLGFSPFSLFWKGKRLMRSLCCPSVVCILPKFLRRLRWSCFPYIPNFVIFCVIHVMSKEVGNYFCLEYLVPFPVYIWFWSFISCHHIVTWWLKAGIADPEKNVGVHIPMVMNNHTITEELEAVFSVLSMLETT